MKIHRGTIDVFIRRSIEVPEQPEEPSVELAKITNSRRTTVTEQPRSRQSQTTERAAATPAEMQMHR